MALFHSIDIATSEPGAPRVSEYDIRVNSPSPASSLLRFSGTSTGRASRSSHTEKANMRASTVHGRRHGSHHQIAHAAGCRIFQRPSAGATGLDAKSVGAPQSTLLVSTQAFGWIASRRHAIAQYDTVLDRLEAPCPSVGAAGCAEEAEPSTAPHPGRADRFRQRDPRDVAPYRVARISRWISSEVIP